MSVVLLLATTATAALASWAFVALLRRWAEQHEILDEPNERSSHDRPVPRGGGLAIVVTTLVGIAAVQALDTPSWSRAEAAAFGFAALAIALVSWLDDLIGVHVGIRIGVHFAAAGLVVLAFGPLNLLEIPGWTRIGFGAAGIGVTVVWIAGLTNAFNFMDGIDGIAAFQAALGGVAWIAIAPPGIHPLGAIAGALVAGAATGFLFHNWHPARIFMGDVGSTFLGFLFATLVVSGVARSPSLLFAASLVLWPFLFDTAFTLLRRMTRRERLFDAHRTHLYQRLTQTGMSHPAVTLIYGALSSVGVCLAIAVERDVNGAAVLGLVLVPALAGILWASTVARERRRPSPQR